MTTWAFNFGSVVLLALAVGYFLLLRRSSVRAGRPVYVFAALVVAAVCFCGFLGVYADTLFWVRAVRTVLLLMVVPLLAALGAPITVLLAAVPDSVATSLRRFGRGRFARGLTWPLTVTALLIAPPFIVYLTPVYAWSLRSSWVDAAVSVGLIAAGFVYFWSRLRIDPTPRADSHAVSLWMSMAEVVFDGVLGLIIWLGPMLAADHYAMAHSGWGPSPRLDQDIGAGILWIGGDLAGLPFLMAMAGRWRRADEQRAQELDRQLDALADPDEPATSGLWWESDPALADRFRQR